MRLIVLACPAVLRYTKPRSSRGTPSDTGTPRQKFPWQKTTRQIPGKPTIPRPTRHYILPVQLRSKEFFRSLPTALAPQNSELSLTIQNGDRTKPKIQAIAPFPPWRNGDRAVLAVKGSLTPQRTRPRPLRPLCEPSTRKKREDFRKGKSKST